MGKGVAKNDYARMRPKINVLGGEEGDDLGSTFAQAALDEFDGEVGTNHDLELKVERSSLCRLDIFRQLKDVRRRTHFDFLVGHSEIVVRQTSYVLKSIPSVL